MRIYIFLLISIFIFSSCSINGNNDKDKIIGDLNKQIVDLKKNQEKEFFQNKLECYKLDKQIQEDTSGVGKTFYNADNPPIIEEIFYSPSRKSCFFVLDETQNGMPITSWLFEFGSHYSSNSQSEFYCNFKDFKGNNIDQGGHEEEILSTGCSKRFNEKVKELKKY